eukprot:scaffold37112_cov35-Tisochrysis_lutea.AAC.1
MFGVATRSWTPRSLGVFLASLSSVRTNLPIRPQIDRKRAPQTQGCPAQGGARQCGRSPGWRRAGLYGPKARGEGRSAAGRADVPHCRSPARPANSLFVSSQSHFPSS